MWLTLRLQISGKRSIPTQRNVGGFRLLTVILKLYTGAFLCLRVPRTCLLNTSLETGKRK